MAALLAVAGAGCGDDDGDPPVDSGTTGMDDGEVDVTPANCPSEAPDRDAMRGACCWRASNADRLDNPELRLAAINMTAPDSLNSAIIKGLLQGALDEERFNWVIRASVTGTDVTIETGYGKRNEGGTFSFVAGEAPGPGDANRWDPVTLTGTLSGDSLTTDQLDGTLTVPIIEEDGTSILAELPLRQLELTMAELSENRTCIGERRASSYGTDSGELTAYITVEEAKAVALNVGTTLNSSLCGLLSGMSAEASLTPCADTPQTDWPVKPDSVCDASGCSLGGCDAGSDCNAWQLISGFAAQGVEITD